MHSLRFPYFPLPKITNVPVKSRPSSPFSVVPKLHKLNLSSANPHAAAEDHCTQVKSWELVDREEKGDHQVAEELAAAGLRAELMPKHVAVIMDGNRRWALERGLSVEDGHRGGGRVMKQIVEICLKLGVKVLTFFAFSTENWIRPAVSGLLFFVFAALPFNFSISHLCLSIGRLIYGPCMQEEVAFLMSLFEEVINSDLEDFKRLGVRMSVIGNKSELPMSLQGLIRLAEESTKANSKLQLVGAMNYSGRYDITQACKSIAKKVKDGLLPLQEIDEALFQQELETKCIEFPQPDLLIRTSGELRVSNFMLWQMAYTELVFVEKLYPDFGEADFIAAVSSFQKRGRRRGGNKY
ncbi:hypothetical protein RJ640_025900 [Escallonia rubra]|uniref:Alkyl transferase n=1 Tax=Escallonia rubra TaxID=112253 RepID=A0AA88QH27_9ASTE|nr:hypothetical protein RJ640_025900 [Escallonia rubra]